MGIEFAENGYNLHHELQHANDESLVIENPQIIGIGSDLGLLGVDRLLNNVNFNPKPNSHLAFFFTLYLSQPGKPPIGCSVITDGVIYVLVENGAVSNRHLVVSRRVLDYIKDKITKLIG